MVGNESSPVQNQNSQPTPAGRGDRLRAGISLALLLLVVVVLVRAIGSLASPYPSSSSLASLQLNIGPTNRLDDGKKIYTEQCASCHGSQGNRIPVAPLNSRQYVSNLGNRLEQAVTEGRGTMPAWGKERGGPLDSKQVKSVGEYIRMVLATTDAGASALATATPSPVPPTATPAPVAHSAPPPIDHNIKDQANRCLDCHGRDAQVPEPVNHAGRTNNSCTLCHVQAGTPTP